MVKLQHFGLHMCKRSGSLAVSRAGFTGAVCKKLAFLVCALSQGSHSSRRVLFSLTEFRLPILSRAFLFDLLHADIMMLDNFKCYSWMCIALKKVKDEWVKDERKIDGYREKKIRRNSQREAERWTEKQTGSKDRD